MDTSVFYVSCSSYNLQWIVFGFVKCIFDRFCTLIRLSDATMVLNNSHINLDLLGIQSLNCHGTLPYYNFQIRLITIKILQFLLLFIVYKQVRTVLLVLRNCKTESFSESTC